MGQNLRADSLRHKHIRFMGVQRGVLGVQADRAADLPWPIPWKPAGGSWLEVQELTHEPANPDAGDPEVIEAMVESLQHTEDHMKRMTDNELTHAILGART